MIYLFQELDLISNELLHQMIFSLPVARREYVQHFKLPEDQKRSALAWLLLRYGLKQEYGFREVPDFQRTTSGKSRISRKPLLGNHFSVGKICRFLISATAEIS